MRRLNNYAVSEILGYIIVLSIIAISVSVIMFWGTSYLAEKKSDIVQDTILIQLGSVQKEVNNLVNQGVNNTAFMDIKIDNTGVSFKENTSRFVVYYSTYKYDPSSSNGFFFNITDIHDNKFRFGDTSKINAQLTFNLTQLTSPYLSSNAGPYTVTSNGNLEDFYVTFAGNIEIKGLVEITIKDQNTNVEYGRIWVVDTDSLDFNVLSGSYKRVVFENGGVITVTGGSYLYDKPTNWIKTLLDGSKIVTISFSNFKQNGGYSLNEVGSVDAKLSIKLEKSIFLTREPVYYNVILMVSGDGSLVNAWNGYFKELGFKDYTTSFGENCLIYKSANYFSANYFEFLGSFKEVS